MTLRIIAAGGGTLFLGLPVVQDEAERAPGALPVVYTPGRVEIGADRAASGPALVIEFSDVHSYSRWLRRLADEADDFVAGGTPVRVELEDGSTTLIHP